MKTALQTSTQTVEIPIEGGGLGGYLSVPDKAIGIVLFAHGSGSGRNSPRNQFVAQVLQEARIATLLFDLLDEEEAGFRANVFDIELLATRLNGAADWVKSRTDVGGLPLGYFGASTGAAAALIASVWQNGHVAGIVSRGGRPDLAGGYLPSVIAPTLFIVGGADDEVLELNKRAYAKLKCDKKLTVIPNATHLFAERGALEQAAQHASNWFQQCFLASSDSR